MENLNILTMIIMIKRRSVSYDDFCRLACGLGENIQH
nr:MAG TPA: hypothetical protein [Microviridae sp.]